MTKLRDYRTTVVQEWIDYNNHLSEAFYVLIFGHATDAIMDQLGLGPQVSGSALFTVESHVRFLREIGLGTEVVVTAAVVQVKEKTLHLAYEMVAGGEVVATEEILLVHVAGAPARAVAFPAPVAERLAAMLTGAPIPGWVGRAVGDLN